MMLVTWREKGVRKTRGGFADWESAAVFARDLVIGAGRFDVSIHEEE